MTEKEMTLVGRDGDGKVSSMWMNLAKNQLQILTSWSFDVDAFQVATVRPSSFSSGNADNIVVSKYDNSIFRICNMTHATQSD